MPGDGANFGQFCFEICFLLGSWVCRYDREGRCSHCRTPDVVDEQNPEPQRRLTWLLLNGTFGVFHGLENLSGDVHVALSVC